MLIDRAPVNVQRGSEKEGPITVFVTNDLTADTLKEAIAEGASLIITYHPRPFNKFKKVTNSDPTTSIVLACAAQVIVVVTVFLTFLQFVLNVLHTQC
jgi:putative NIF3 family GTP cyclohydrolase 1 type 2